VTAIPEKALDLDVLGDLRTPWCLRVVATLRIADHVAAGVSDVGQLAVAADCDPDYLRLVMHSASSLERLRSKSGYWNACI
jgi:hypothetical protein